MSAWPEAGYDSTVTQVLEALRSELDTLGVAPKASLVWKIDCSEGDVSDADLDAFAAYGAGIAPEKVRLVMRLAHA